MVASGLKWSPGRQPGLRMTRARARRRTAAGRRPTKDSMGMGLCRRRIGYQSRTSGEHTRRLCHSNSLRSPAYLTLALLLTHRTPSTLSMDDSCDCGSSKVPMSNAIVVSRPPLPPVLPQSSLGHCRCLSCHRCFDQGCGDVPIGQTASMSRASAHHIHTALPVECPYSGHSTGNGLRLTIKTGCFIVRICAAAGRPFEVGRRPDRQVVMTRDRRGGRPGGRPAGRPPGRPRESAAWWRAPGWRDGSHPSS